MVTPKKVDLLAVDHFVHVPCKSAKGCIGDECLKLVLVLEETSAVENGPRWAGDSQAITHARVSTFKRGAPDNDARAPDVPTWMDSHPWMRRCRIRPKSPDRCRAPMTQDGTITAGKEGGLRVGVLGRHGTDEVDPAMERNQPAIRQPCLDLHLGQSGCPPNDFRAPLES